MSFEISCHLTLKPISGMDGMGWMGWLSPFDGLLRAPTVLIMMTRSCHPREEPNTCDQSVDDANGNGDNIDNKNDDEELSPLICAKHLEMVTIYSYKNYIDEELSPPR